MDYWRIVIKNLEPLSISDDSTSQSGQTDCCRYIPGITLRGYVISKLSHDQELFNKYKSELFSDICFLNGYPVGFADGVEYELMPSLKGFYEHKKGDCNIKSVVVDGEFEEGMKRAALGTFCRVSGNTVHYCNIETRSSMKIKIGTGKDQKVFRSKFIPPGYTFVSYIGAKKDTPTELKQAVKDCFGNETLITLGNGRSQGLGKCRVTVSECESPTWIDTAFSEDITDGSLYMILLSNTVMRDEYGEYCGINVEELKGLLGVERLGIDYCATSVVTVHGYNSTWGTKLPTVPMYEQGSVFKLSFTGTLTRERIKNIYDIGIGERKTEGFGRVVFRDDAFEKLSHKAEMSLKLASNENMQQTDEDKRVLEVIAVNYYKHLIREAEQKKIVEDSKGIGITHNQAGTVLSILEKNKYNPDVSKVLEKYFGHAEEKEDHQKKQKDRNSIKGFSSKITDILNDDITEYLGVKNEIMGISVSDLISTEEREQMKVSYKVSYVIDLIRYSMKEEA